MDFERWVASKIESLKMKTMAENSRMPIPKKVLEKVSKCDPNEKNAHGESIMISVVRYINDEMRQVKYLQVLLRTEADPNMGDTRHGKTPLMFACQEKKRAACRVLMNHVRYHKNSPVKHDLSLPSVDPLVKDHLGNTALTYANNAADPYILSVVNCESLNDETSTTTKNIKKTFANEKQFHLLQTMHQQLALVKSNSNIKNVSDYHAYKSGKIWLQKSLSLNSYSSDIHLPSIHSSQSNIAERTIL